MLNPELKKTPLYRLHKKMGARMVSFAGWLMPVQYTGIIEEHMAVRNSAGLFDVSHMGQIEISGKDALSAVQYITTNDASKLFPGRVQYTLICNEKGGVVDDVTLYKIDKEIYLFCVNAGNTDKVYRWMKEKVKNYQVKVEDKSSAFCLIALQGPKAQNILQGLCSDKLSTIKYYHFKHIKVAGSHSIISRTGYTGEDGFEIYSPVKDAEAIWKKLLDGGAIPCGLGARDTLRLEMDYCLYGHELSESISPIEAGLGWAVKINKPDFIGREELQKKISNGLNKRLVGIEMEESGIARQGCSILSDDTRVGEVTSGTFSPSLKKAIALAYVSKEVASIGHRFYVELRGRTKKAVVVPTPFYKPAKEKSNVCIKL